MTPVIASIAIVAGLMLAAMDRDPFAAPRHQSAGRSPGGRALARLQNRCCAYANALRQGLAGARGLAAWTPGTPK